MRARISERRGLHARRNPDAEACGWENALSHGKKRREKKGPGHALEAALGSWAAAARPALRKAGREQQRAPGKRP